MNTYDLIIVGGGPIGLACAIEAQKKGLRYLIIEKGAIVNSIFNYPLYMTFFSTAERLEIGEIPFSCLAPKPGRQEALEYYRNIHRYFNFSIHLFERVTQVEKLADTTFKITTDKALYGAANVIIATGFYDIPIEMEVKGEELPKVRHYYKEAHEYAFRNVLVVGANDVVNPAAKTDPSSPIFGMPILDVENATNIIVNKRSMNAGYAGIDNLLFYQPKTSMLFGDAKGVLAKLVSELKQM